MTKRHPTVDIKKMRRAFAAVDGNPGPFPKVKLSTVVFKSNNPAEIRITIDAEAREKLLQMHRNLVDGCVAMTMSIARANQAFVEFGLSLKALRSARRGAPARRRGI